MQIFLAHSNFSKNAKILDKKRLFKQLVECRQVLATMGEPILKNDGSPMKASHVHHPIHKMWSGYAECLKDYHNAILMECLDRGIKTIIQPLQVDKRKMKIPPFIGSRKFHNSHKSNLLRKNPEWYSQFKWNVKSDIPYFWG